MACLARQTFCRSRYGCIICCYALLVFHMDTTWHDTVSQLRKFSCFARQEKVAVRWLYGHAMLGTKADQLCDAGPPQLDDEQRGHFDSLDLKKITNEVCNLTYLNSYCNIMLWYMILPS